MSGWGHPISSFFSSMGLGNLFLPLICSFPHHHDLKSTDVKYCQIPKSCRQYVQEKFLLQFSTPDPLLVLIHYHLIPLSRVDDVGNIMALLRLITSCRLQLIIQEADLETLFWYPRACMPQWQVLRIRRQVLIIGLRSHDFTSVRLQFTVHIPRILLVVP